MSSFKQTGIWKRTLSARDGDDPAAGNRRRLREEFEQFRERAAQLASYIQKSLPHYTLHDVSHLDALWNLSDKIAGTSVDLTPTEGFVLGGAFLIHDLGLAVAAYPEGVESLKQTTIWRDTVAGLYEEASGRPASNEIIQDPPEAIAVRAKAETLRSLHAEHAEGLGLITWEDESKGAEYSLIEDPGLREPYGSIIGRIAHSHWWDVDRIPRELPEELGVPLDFPQTWTVDPVKLACILRIADAAHLDSSRAPSFHKALRSLDDESERHWTFQNKLFPATRSGDRLVYTSQQPFSIDEAAAWWTCHDMLLRLDDELREVDALLSDTGRSRLAVKGVAAVHDPGRLAEKIETTDWHPVDTRIQVSKVASLVRTLGGEQLYGAEITAPLRELIQNAADAVKARRALQERAEEWGQITVAVGGEAGSRWLEVQDNGVGMSKSVLTGPFLDFGSSFWGSPQMRQELPGLQSTNFHPTGQFGIGFFSVFMWGGSVSVITRRYDQGQSNTQVLEFQDGLQERPLLRAASPSEQLSDGGTRVRVRFSNEKQWESFLEPQPSTSLWELSELCEWIAPALDVDLYCRAADQDTSTRVVTANDWLEISPKQLLRRINGPERVRRRGPLDLQDYVTETIQVLRGDDGNAVARLGMMPPGSAAEGDEETRTQPDGVVTVGGLRSCGLRRLGGVAKGATLSASRYIAVPSIGHELLSGFAALQASILDDWNFPVPVQRQLAELVLNCLGDPGNLVLGYGPDGWMSLSEMGNLAADHDEVYLVPFYQLANRWRREQETISLRDDTFAVDAYPSNLLRTGSGSGHHVRWPWAPRQYHVLRHYGFTPRGAMSRLAELVAEEWDVPLIDVLEHSSYRGSWQDRELAKRDGAPLVLPSQRLSRPDGSVSGWWDE